MAKELPYFKFEPAEYLTKDISFCSLSAQGLFINICSYYWQRGCELTKQQLLKRLNHEKELNELIEEGTIDVIGNDIKIKFLDIQLLELEARSVVNKVNGSKGGRPKKEVVETIIKTETKPNNNPTVNQNETETKGIRIEENRTEDKSKSKKRLSDFELFWELYDRKVDKPSAKNKFLELKDSDVVKIFEVVEKYVKSTPELKYRKHPARWLKGECWNDHINDSEIKPKLFRCTYQNFLGNITVDHTEEQIAEKIKTGVSKLTKKIEI